jgi:hypothetical protein
MKQCKCGVNDWRWNCKDGMMEGTCKGCGRKTNKFKANGSHTKKV